MTENAGVDNKLTEKVIGCAIRVHSELGPGLLESAYEECLYFELNRNGIHAERQKALPLRYYDVNLECGYRVDLLIENKVIVEVKACEALTDVHKAQVLTYLKLSGCKLGLLINFNVNKLVNGIKRLIF
ncbi:MAG: GxxExxY protein [Ignavibacteria bacterium]|nr:GxxExxY protein [Ignavibacteria bacterium]